MAQSFVLGCCPTWTISCRSASDCLCSTHPPDLLTPVNLRSPCRNMIISGDCEHGLKCTDDHICRDQLWTGTCPRGGAEHGSTCEHYHLTQPSDMEALRDMFRGWMQQTAPAPAPAPAPSPDHDLHGQQTLPLSCHLPLLTDSRGGNHPGRLLLAIVPPHP